MSTSVEAPAQKPLGRLLREADAVGERELEEALEEQARSGGRIGEVLRARGAVAGPALVDALSKQLGVPLARPEERGVNRLPADQARELRAVVLSGSRDADGPRAVAFADPSDPTRTAVERHLEDRVEARLVDESRLDALLAEVYGDEDGRELPSALRHSWPELSAFTNRLSFAQLAAGGLAVALIFSLALIDPLGPLVALVGLGIALFVAFPGLRLLLVSKGLQDDATIAPTRDDLEALDSRTLPRYTVLLPVFGEKPSTLRSLFGALDAFDYPTYKLDAILLTEPDDGETRAALATVGCPPWLRVLEVPATGPRTKPKALLHGLRYARGSYVTVYDAEDRPEPEQLRAAVWAFRRVEASVACLQSRLDYYNPRHNLLTRWFTLEYDAWFGLVLPGLHQMRFPIPLAGTSNHFRIEVLRGCGAWDPYNVTEDADLGLRLARLGWETRMLKSTTWEEANSRVGNWLRQRSRWIKGYLQTFLVHTRHPRELLHDLGPRNAAAAVLLIGGAVLTTLMFPVFLSLLILWTLFQPEFILDLLPVPVYYFALASLVIGDFLLILLGVATAVARGQDDLVRQALILPLYWLLMSLAGYMAVMDLVRRPHHWQKTEHGLGSVTDEPLRTVGLVEHSHPDGPLPARHPAGGSCTSSRWI